MQHAPGGADSAASHVVHVLSCMLFMYTHLNFDSCHDPSLPNSCVRASALPNLLLDFLNRRSNGVHVPSVRWRSQ